MVFIYCSAIDYTLNRCFFIIEQKKKKSAFVENLRFLHAIKVHCVRGDIFQRANRIYFSIRKFS